jgi:CotH protein/parallel beta helix pectate lyase-like protein
VSSPGSLPRKWKVLIVANLVVLLLACGFGAVILRHQIARVVVPFLRRESPMRNPSVLVDSGLPVYDLRVSQTQLRKLVAVTNAARDKQILTDDLKQWFRARFIYEGVNYKCKIRIRGDQWHHWRGGHQSWRVRFDKENPFQGRRDINLILPSTRTYVGEKMAMDVGKRLGLMVPKNRFCVLRINSIIQGLYFEVEHFGEEMLAHQARPETPILASQDRWLDSMWYLPGGSVGVMDDHNLIGTMGEVRSYIDDPAQNALAMGAFEQLLGALADPSPAALPKALQLLDADKFARLYALLPLMGSHHVEMLRVNMRLYHDTSRGLFEPIVWDVRLMKLEDPSIGHPTSPRMRTRTLDVFIDRPMSNFRRRFLAIDRFQHRRNTLLWGLVKDGGKELLADFKKLQDDLKPLVNADPYIRDDWRDDWDKMCDALPHNITRIRKVLGFTRATVVVRLTADPNVARVTITPDQFSALKLQQLTLTVPEGLKPGEVTLLRDADGDGRLTGADAALARTSKVNKDRSLALRIGSEVLLHSGRRYHATAPYALVPVPRDYHFFVRTEQPLVRALMIDPDQLVIGAQNAVTGDKLPRHRQLINVVDADQVFDLDAAIRSRAAFLKSNPQFRALGQDAVSISKGMHEFRKTVIIPAGVRLVISPGATLQLGPGVSIFCFGSITAKGTEADPILLDPLESGKPWGVLASIRSGAASTFTHVSTNLSSEARVNGIFCSGGIAVHGGDAVFQRCTFARARGDDALNVKNGKAIIRGCRFIRNSSDAIDLDNCTGVVERSVFNNNNGDGIDLSWSHIVIRENTILRCADKGISVGEQSTPLIYDNLILGCAYGVAVKDMSRAMVLFTTFQENKIAIGLYQKKRAFGGARADVANCVFYRDKAVLLSDPQSEAKVSACLSQGVPETDGVTDTKLDFIDQDDLRLKKTSIPSDYELGSELPEAAKVKFNEGDIPGVRVELPAMETWK